MSGKLAQGCPRSSRPATVAVPRMRRESQTVQCLRRFGSLNRSEFHGAAWWVLSSNSRLSPAVATCTSSTCEMPRLHASSSANISPLEPSCADFLALLTLSTCSLTLDSSASSSFRTASNCTLPISQAFLPDSSSRDKFICRPERYELEVYAFRRAVCHWPTSPAFDGRSGASYRDKSIPPTLGALFSTLCISFCDHSEKLGLYSAGRAGCVVFRKPFGNSFEIRASTLARSA